MEQPDQAERNLLRAKTARGAVWVTVSKMATQVLTYVSSILVMNRVAPADYGANDIAMLVVALASFTELGLGDAIVQRKEIRGESITRVFWFVLAVSVVLTALSYCSAPWVAHHFNSPRSADVVRVLSVLFLLVGLSAVPLKMLMRSMDLPSVARAELFSSVTQTVATLGLALIGLGIWALALGWLARHVVQAATLWAMARWWPTRGALGLPERSLMSFGAKRAGTQALWYVYSRADTYVVGKRLGVEMLGLYSNAFALAAAPLDRINEILSQFAFPVFSRLQSDLEELRRYFLQMSKAVALMLFPAFAGMALVADDFIHALIPDRLPIIVPVRILCGLAAFRAVLLLMGELLNALNKVHINLYSMLMRVTVMPLAFYIAAQSGYGLVGVALAWVIVFPLLATYQVYHALRALRLRFSSWLANFREPLLGTMVVVAAVSLVEAVAASDIAAVRLAVSCAVGAVAYFCCLVLLFPGTFSLLKTFVRLARTQPA